MKIILTTTLITLLIVNTVTGQTNSSSNISKLQNDVFITYDNVSANKDLNYFQVLNQTYSSTFNVRNVNYTTAITELVNAEHVKEEVAVNKIYSTINTALKKDHLWNSATEVTELDKEILAVYNDALCPCITAGIDKESGMEKLSKVQQECVAKLVTDTIFLRRIKEVAGANTLNNMYRLQRYLFLLMYEKCDILGDRFDKSIFQLAVLDQYFEGINERRRSEALKVLDYFEKNKADSLVKIFPAYKQYTSMLKEAVRQKKLKKNTFHPYYVGRMMDNSKPNVSVDIRDKDLMGVQLTFFYTAHAINATITSAKIEYFKTPVKVQEDQIIEIKEN